MDYREVIKSGIQQGLFSEELEKTNVDKLLAKEEVNQARAIVNKEHTDGSDYMKLFDFLVGTELKLFSFDNAGRDRYVLGKYIVWAGEIVKIPYFLHKYKKERYDLLSDSGKKTFDHILDISEKNAKTVIEIFQYWARSSLSMNATGFKQLGTAKYEFTDTPQEPKIEVKK